jgi:hypothetical protein
MSIAKLPPSAAVTLVAAVERAAGRIGADGIAIAARGRVLGQLGATLEACTSCHSTWKQQVVDEASWQRLTTTAPTAHGTMR